MEYIEGETLARLMARALARAQPIPRPVLIRIVLDALAGLHAAHELVDPRRQPADLVHRDVSPQNMLVGVDGSSRITDFGVAHAASRLQNTRADRLKGKIAYMSPEQARAGEVDRRADVFAMGIVLWEVLAARRLFKADSEAITLQRITVEPIPRLSQALPGVHPALDRVSTKALARDRDERFLSAAEMAEALERAAREAASASTTDLGVASPREVAAYVQGALGEDIAAQRESVRAWLAHSEPSMPRLSGVKLGEAPRANPGAAGRPPVTMGPQAAPNPGAAGRPPVTMGPQAAPNPGAAGRPPGYDVTMKIPLDRPASSYVDRPPRSPPPPRPPEAPHPAYAAAEANLGSPMPPARPVTMQRPPMPPGPAGVHEALGISRPASGAPHLAVVPEPLDETPVEPMADDDDDHETLLMDSEAARAATRAARLAREATAAPAPTPAPPPQPASARVPPFAEEGTTPSKSIESFSLPAAPPPSRTPESSPSSWASPSRSSGSSCSCSSAATTPPTTPAATGSPPPPSATPAPPPPPPAPPKPTVEATPVSALPPADPPKLGRGRLPRAKVSARPVEAPVPAPAPTLAPAPAPEPKLPDDMTNPYKPPQ